MGRELIPLIPKESLLFINRSALHYAVKASNRLIAKLLLDSKADINALTYDGFSPLHIACVAGDLEWVEFLLDEGANPDVCLEGRVSARRRPKSCSSFSPPIHTAVIHRFTHILKCLLESQCNPNLCDSNGVTALHIAAGVPCLEILNLLLGAGANLAITDRSKSPPLFYAVRAGILENVEKLISPEIISMANSDKETALHIASRSGQTSIVSFLIGQKADHSLTDVLGNTPLHYATIGKHLDCVKALVEYGSDIMARNNENKSPYGLSSGVMARLMRDRLGDHPIHPQRQSPVKVSRKPTSVAASSPSSAARSRNLKGKPQKKEEKKQKETDDLPEDLEGLEELITREIEAVSDRLQNRMIEVRRLIDDLRNDLL
jgi:ankyrin repeat protein